MADDKLLGDIVAEQLKKVHADKIAAAISNVTKKPCGCKKRQEQLNDLHARVKQRVENK